MTARLTREQSRQVRSLIEDGGYSRADARALVLAGFGEPQPEDEPCCQCSGGFDVVQFHDPGASDGYGERKVACGCRCHVRSR